MQAEKDLQYRRLIEDVKAAYRIGSSDLKWCSDDDNDNDCKEINLWTYWQGRGHLDARILLVGQDWGCPWDDLSVPIMERIRQMNQGLSVPYIERYPPAENQKEFFTDRSLIKLFDSIGFDICKDDPRLFFTNFVLGYRQKGTSGNFQRRWAKQDTVFFSRLVEIIKPHIILCLGKDTFKSVLSSFSYQLPSSSPRNFNHFIESNQNPVSVSYADGTPAHVFALAHCGVMGTLNRNRGTDAGRCLKLQVADWQRILPFFWRDPVLLNTYWDRAIALLQEIDASEEKKAWCSVCPLSYPSPERQDSLLQDLHWFYEATYQNNLVICNYLDIIHSHGLSEAQIVGAEPNWVRSLSLWETVASIAYHFRRDHFCNGSLESESIAHGCLLRLLTHLKSLLG